MSEQSKQIRKELLKQGLTPGTKVYESARSRLRYQLNRRDELARWHARYRRNKRAIRERVRRRYKEDPKFRESVLAKGRRYYASARGREASLERKRKWVKENREYVRAYCRRRYNERKKAESDFLKKIYANRSRNNPCYGLTKYIRRFKSGDINVNELDKKFSAAFARLNEISCATAARRTRGDSNKSYAAR